MYNLYNLKRGRVYDLKRKTRNHLCVLLSAAVLMIAVLSGCAAKELKIRLSGEQEYFPAAAAQIYRQTDENNLSLAASSPLLGLYFDGQNASVSVKNNGSGEYFPSVSTQADEFGLSYAFSVRIAGEDGRFYNLNSRDNSAVFGAFKTEKTENAIAVAYSLALDSRDALAEKESLEKGVLRADITLLFELDGDALCVSADCSKIFISDGYVIESISVLPGFASGKAEKGDYFILPDGCGVLSDISAEAKDDIGYMYYSCGADIACTQTGAKAYLPFFAFKYGGTAVCATVEEGGALALFNYRRLAKRGSGAIYPEFTLTPSEQTEKHLYTGVSYGGIVKVRYTFLANKNISYTDIATVCRERLVRSFTLPAGTLTAQSSVPFLLTAVGASSSERKSSYTEYFEAKEMLAILKAKGVNNIAMRYMGTLSGGLDQKEIGSAKLMKMLGSKSELLALSDYARVQNLEVFFDINILTAGKDGALRKLKGGAVYTDAGAPVKSLFKASDENSCAVSYKKLKSNVSSALSVLGDRNVSLGDISETLYSDASYGFTKQDAMEYISESCRAFGVKRDVMIAKPALYLLKSAKYVASVPLGAEEAFEDNTTVIPFLQTVLHGTVYYAGEPLYGSSDADYAVLKCVEYGCMPSAVITYRAVRADYDTYYVTQCPKLARIYEKMNAQLSDLYGQRITGHMKVYDGVYCTEYANVSLVYVNYTNESVEINGLTLEAMGYMRVN